MNNGDEGQRTSGLPSHALMGGCRMRGAGVDLAVSLEAADTPLALVVL